jgi:Tol biopolymer transport system component/uncharacterized protein YegL
MELYMKNLRVLLLGFLLICMAVPTMALSEDKYWSAERASALQQNSFSRGDVFAAIGDGKVNWYHSDGSFVSTLDTGLGGNTTGMAFDKSGNLYVTNFGSGTVSRFDTHGNLLGTFGSGYSGSPESILFDNLWNAYVGAVDGDNDVRKFDPDGNLITQYDVETKSLTSCLPLLFHDACRGSDWIELAPDQCTLFYNSEASAIKRFDLCGNRQLANFSNELHGPAYALRLTPDGGVLVADNQDIHRLDSNGHIVQTYDVQSVDGWFALNRDPDGKSFWSGSLNSGTFYQFDIVSGNVLLGPIQACNSANCLAGLAIFGELTEALPTPTFIVPSSTNTPSPTRTAIPPTSTSTSTPTPTAIPPTSTSTPIPTPTINLTPSPSDLITMTVRADPEEADVDDSILVEIKLTGDSKNCGQSVVAKPVDVLLVLDHSGSMAGEPLAQAKLAAKAFITEMDLSADRVGILQFDDTAQLIQEMTTDTARLAAAIDGIPEGGGTSVAEGLRVAYESLKSNSRIDAIPVIVLLSDGGSDPSEALRVADTAKAAGIQIVTVALGTADEDLLKSIASLNEKNLPRYYKSVDPSGLKAIYISIARDIREYGLAKDLALKVVVDIYKYKIIPTSLNPAGEVAGNRITWRQGVLENGETTFTFQVQGRVEGKYPVADLIRADFLECEQNYRFLQIEDTPVVTILPTQPRVCESACSWWQLFPWWWLAPILLLFLLALLLWLTPLGKNLWKKPWVCKLLAALTLLYSLFLITLIARSLIGNLCNADNIYFWKINQAGDVGIYVTRFGEQSASPVQSMNRGSECVACHAVSGSKENPILTAVRDEQNGLILMQSLTGEEVPIPPVNGSYLAWSPDGKQAAISMNDKDIQILDLKTGTLTPLAGASEANVVETMPAWSPDGTTIAFVRAVRTSPDTARIDVPADIYTVPASGGTALPLPGASGEGFNYYPVYSPDGKWLAFTHHTTGKDTYADDAADLYLVPAGGGQRILLRANRTDFADSWPSWSPDGQWLGFSSDRLNGQFDIYLAKIGSNGQSTEACILPGASSATDEEFHPVWVVPVKKPWWLRLLALWPWLIPLVALLILGWLFCRKRENVLVVRTVNAISGETIEDAKIDIQPRP